MKKRLYEKPNIQLVPIVPEQAVADVCWAYAKNKQPFYYNVPGRGYAILKIASGGGCNGGVLFDIDYSATDLTPEEIASFDAHMEKVIAQAKAAAGNNATPFKGSPFSGSTDSSWS